MPAFNEDTAVQGGGGDLIPAGTLVWLTASNRGMVASRNTGGNMADLEFTVLEGPYARRKVWLYLLDCDDPKNSEKARQMHMGHMARMLESIGVCVPGRPETYTNPRLATFAGAVGVIVAGTNAGRRIGAKIGIEKGSGGHKDKNTIAVFLSPNPKSGSVRDWERLQSGAGAPAQVAAPGAAPPAWHTGQQAPTPAVQAQPAGNPLAPPAWTQAPQAPAPAAAGRLLDDDIPF